VRVFQDGNLISWDYCVDGGIKTDPDKVSVVKNWPAIKNVKDLRKFLGFTSYYRRFI
jgi:hypothetical protein